MRGRSAIKSIEVKNRFRSAMLGRSGCTDERSQGLRKLAWLDCGWGAVGKGKWFQVRLMVRGLQRLRHDGQKSGKMVLPSRWSRTLFCRKASRVGWQTGAPKAVRRKNKSPVMSLIVAVGESEKGERETETQDGDAEEAAYG